MLSIWERNSFLHYDHIVIGGGIVGLTTAYYLKQRFPKNSVLVLERGLLPSGASTKNAGFACMGSPSELLDDLLHSSEEEGLSLFALRKKGLERLRTLLGDEVIAYREQGSYELLFKSDMYILDQLEYLNNLLFKELKTNAFTIENDKINQFQFDGKLVQALVRNTCEGELDTGKMMRSLIQLAIQSGVEIKTGCHVNRFQQLQNEADVVCSSIIDQDEINFKASTLFICNNAFAKKLLPDYNIEPGRGQVMITKPIPNLPFQGIFHFDKGYYYFREYNGCVLFGGGRNLDFKKENTTDFALNESIQHELQVKLKKIILPNHDFEVDLKWTGIMAFGDHKKPIVKQHDQTIYVGVRMGGMGVAIGSEIGFQLANML